MLDNFDEKDRDSKEGAWGSGAKIEIPYIYIFYGEKVHKFNMWEKIKQFKRKLIFQKTRIFILLNQTILIGRFYSYVYLLMGSLHGR